MRTPFCLLALVLLFAGCVPPPPPADNGNENGTANTNGAGRVTVLKAGAYSGTLDVTAELRMNGDVVDTQQFTRTLTEAISAEGVPVTSAGQPLIVGEFLSLVEAPPDVVTARVDSLTEIGNQLVVALSLSGSRQVAAGGGSVAVSGVGTTRYTAVSETQIDFFLSLEYQGVSTDGNSLRQTEVHNGRLSR